MKLLTRPAIPLFEKFYMGGDPLASFSGGSKLERAAWTKALRSSVGAANKHWATVIRISVTVETKR